MKLLLVTSLLLSACGPPAHIIHPGKFSTAQVQEVIDGTLDAVTALYPGARLATYENDWDIYITQGLSTVKARCPVEAFACAKSSGEVWVGVDLWQCSARSNLVHEVIHLAGYALGDDGWSNHPARLFGQEDGSVEHDAQAQLMQAQGCTIALRSEDH
jgi:hypothetical protein